MKNFIFAMCGFLMMSLVSLSVQASSISESSKCEYVIPLFNVGLPDIQCATFEVAPVNCFASTAPQPIFIIANVSMQSVASMNTVMRGKQIIVPKCPFRYVYKSKYCTHYSYTAYSRLITPY